jgi:diacylglycerol kinase family enzyme
VTEPLTCVIYNPFAGRGRARKRIDVARKRAAPDADVRATEGPGHGVELAREAVQGGYTRIVAAGGDGTVHEVANGLLQANQPATTLAVWPLGSSNDYAYSLGLDAWWKSCGRATPPAGTSVDVGRISGAGRERFFVNCSGVGFNGMVALESRGIRWLRGIPLYGLAFLRAMCWHFRTPKLAVAFDNTPVERPTLALTVNVGKKEGGFPITDGAKLDDGRFDFLHVADVRRWELLRYLPGLIVGKLPVGHAKIATGTAATVRVTGGTPLCVHADGEFYCKPEDDVREVTFETLPRRLVVEAVVGS